MTIGEKSRYPNFNYSKNAKKIFGLRDGDIDVLLKCYNLTHKELEEMIVSIREWYKKQPHLPQGQLHDRMILGHLMTRNFSVEQTKKMIDNYFAASDKMPDLIGGRWPFPANCAKYLKEGYWCLSPMKTADNHRVIIFSIVNPEMVVLDVAKLGFMLGEYRLFNETTQGDHWVFDFSNATLSHVTQFNPLLVSKIYYHLTSAYSSKIKGLHLINVPLYGQTILGFLKKIITTKHSSRLHLYDSFEKIFNVLPKKVFPKDLGGSLNMTVQDISSLWYETIMSDDWQQFFENQHKNFHVNESKRLSAPKIDGPFGVEGSFRKLELD